MNELNFPPVCLHCHHPLRTPYGDDDYHGPWWAPFGRSDRLFRATCCGAIVEFQQCAQTWRLYPDADAERQRLRDADTIKCAALARMAAR